MRKNVLPTLFLIYSIKKGLGDMQSGESEKCIFLANGHKMPETTKGKRAGSGAEAHRGLGGPLTVKLCRLPATEKSVLRIFELK